MERQVKGVGRRGRGLGHSNMDVNEEISGSVVALRKADLLKKRHCARNSTNGEVQGGEGEGRGGGESLRER